MTRVDTTTLCVFLYFQLRTHHRKPASQKKTGETMAYKPGDVILENEPFALAVAVKMIPVTCSWCLKTTKEVPLSLCAGCKTLKYCSKTCQKEDWKKGPHKDECKYLKYQRVPAQTRLLARCGS